MGARFHRLTVAICGAGHSGSTLLGLILGAHPDVFYAGEAKKTLFIDDPSKPLRKRVCKLCGASCVVWSRFEQPPSPDLYEHLAQLTGRPVIVDSTKKVAWIRERGHELATTTAAHRFIVLTRDGRAVINSRLRKDPAASVDALTTRWMEQMRETEAWAGSASDRTMRVRYEELALEPERIVRGVCDHIGIGYDLKMLRYELAEHHPLGGNTGTQSVVARAHAMAEPAFADVPERSRDYYQPMKGGFSLDLRWRSELPADALARFEELAGEFNAPYRWDGPEEPS